MKNQISDLAISYFNKAIQSQQKGDVNEAEIHYRRAIKANKNFIAALSNLGNILVEKGQYQEAITKFRKAVKVAPNDPMLLSNLGNALVNYGKHKDALPYIKRSISIAPDNYSAYINLGCALINLNRTDEAVEAWNTAYKLNPQDQNICSNLANIHLSNDNLKEAEKLIDEVGRLAPEHFYTYFLQGLLSYKKFEYEISIDKLKESLKLNDQYPGTYEALANTLISIGHYSDAVKISEHGLKLLPESTELYAILTKAYAKLGDMERTDYYIKRTLDLKPTKADIFIILANAYKTIGDMPNSESMFRKAMKIQPDNPWSYITLPRIKKFETHDKDLQAMEAIYNSEKLTGVAKSALGFAIANCYEQLHDYSSSLSHLIQCNAIKRSLFDYSSDDSRIEFEQIITIFNETSATAAKDKGFHDKTPIFIVGMPRSGTSLAEQILSSHPTVSGAGELVFIEELYHEVSGIETGLPLSFSEFMEHNSLSELGERYLAQLRAAQPDLPRITDKMPQNFMYIGFIKSILPESVIIHCTRDPMDICLSIFKTDFEGGGLRYGYDLDELATYYNLYRQIMTHWKNIYADEIYDFNYERVIYNDEEEIRKLLQFCGLSWDDHCLKFYETRRAVSTASHSQVRKPIYSNSIGLWKKYGPSLEPLQSALEEG